jgi:purine-cytosine permease-like protein
MVLHEQIIVFEEHLIFRRGRWSNYDLDAINNPRALPPGFAAAFALSLGIMGAVLGMAQTWFIGPIGKKIGTTEYGGDVGFELSFAFTGIAYPILRAVEKSVFGR